MDALEDGADEPERARRTILSSPASDAEAAGQAPARS
jgi:hypothetical protein